MIELSLWLGSLLLSLSALPELIVTLKSKKCALSWGFILVAGLGEILVLVPLLIKGADTALLVNYSLNSVIFVIFTHFKMKEL